jgi:hypothetical protein
MMPDMNWRILIALIFLVTQLTVAHARISESELKNYSAEFLSMVIGDNRGYKSIITECLNGMIKNGSAGMRLLDKFGLFIYESRKEGICLKKARFFSADGQFSLFLIFEDDYDGQLYTLYLEYEYRRKEKICILKDVYFSLVFDEKMKKVEEFFKYR